MYARADKDLINSLINERSEFIELPLAPFLDHNSILIKIRVLTKSYGWGSAIKKAESCDPGVSWHDKVLETLAYVVVSIPIIMVTYIFKLLLNVILRRNSKIMLTIIICRFNITLEVFKIIYTSSVHVSIIY